MYVSTTSDSSSVGSVVSSPHFSRLLSNVDRFLRLHPSREYFSLSIPAHQKMTIMVVKKDFKKKKCSKKRKREGKEQRKKVYREVDGQMDGRVAKGIKRRGKVWHDGARKKEERGER